MKKFIPREKLSKKSQKAFASKKRKTWGPINPVTHKTENAKGYNRKKVQKGYFDDFLSEPFMLFAVQQLRRERLDLKKYTKTKTTYPSDEAVKKSVYFSIEEISKSVQESKQ